ncbi:MAG: hybrid sensor histidine kinase/response regulator, partial [Pseudomonadota bacterium]
MEKKILRALIIDDSPDDVEVTLTTLRKAGYTLKMQRVQDATGIQNALAKGEWDVVLCEFALPHFSAEVALELIKNAGLDTPFIVLT